MRVRFSTLVTARSALELMQHHLCRQRVRGHLELWLHPQQQQLTAARTPAELGPAGRVDHRATTPLRHAAVRHLHTHRLPAALGAHSRRRRRRRRRWRIVGRLQAADGARLQPHRLHDIAHDLARRAAIAAASTVAAHAAAAHAATGGGFQRGGGGC